MTSGLSSRGRRPLAVKLPTFPASGILLGLAAAFAWGVACGLPRGPFWAVAIGGLAAAGLSLWLERRALEPPAGAGRAATALMLAAAYAFLTLVATGIVSLGYFLGEWLLRH